MNFLKKSMKSIVAFSLCLCTILSITVFNASAAETTKVMEYYTPVEDSRVSVYSTEGGTVKCEKATAGFIMETGVRVYKAIPNEGYKFDGWTYKLTMQTCIYKEGIKEGPDKGNRVSLGRYTFSKVGNKKTAYNGIDDKIQLNRLSACGEFLNAATLCYTITANFSKI